MFINWYDNGCDLSATSITKWVTLLKPYDQFKQTLYIRKKRGREGERGLKSGQCLSKSIVDQSTVMLMLHGMLTWLVHLDSTLMWHGEMS